ncbi:hypothetical protein OESDEN_06462 [Oesophagostomum dentatum]|uniref:Uncharacterized protein n=1 Tax=Oesophagostomum dentatum TaxID=61180 RepID=A0A0B1TBZ0_OESDE|nr:hypothetical protein OESDEN_06462 [Oesophagostomum dentatum]
MLSKTHQSQNTKIPAKMRTLLIISFALLLDALQIAESDDDADCDLNCTLECEPPTICTLVQTSGCPNASCHNPRLDFPISPPPDENITPSY